MFIINSDSTLTPVQSSDSNDNLSFVSQSIVKSLPQGNQIIKKQATKSKSNSQPPSKKTKLLDDNDVVCIEV